jgi:single-stranded DNA-binding protein
MARLVLLGNLQESPELKTSKKNEEYYSFTVIDEKQYYFVMCNPSLLANTYLKKGDMVSVIGIPSSSAYKAKDGDIKSSIRCSAKSIEKISQNDNNNSQENNNNDNSTIASDDIPF